MNPTALYRQFSAELLKARKRSLFFGVLGLLLFFAVLPLPIALAGLSNTGVREWARDIVSFPGCILNTLQLSSLALPLIVTVVAAGAVGSEFSGNTWKMTLPRTTSRASPLVAKFLATLVLTLVSLAFTLAFATATGAVGSLILGQPFVPVPVDPKAGDLGRMVAYFTLQFGCIISLAMLASVATRSFIGGALSAFVIQQVMRALAFIPGGWLLPMSNLDWLQAKWLTGDPRKLAEMEATLGRAMSWQASTATVVAFSLGFILLAVWLFERRDLTSE